MSDTFISECVVDSDELTPNGEPIPVGRLTSLARYAATSWAPHVYEASWDSHSFCRVAGKSRGNRDFGPTGFR
jgi:hypothetical protein